MVGQPLEFTIEAPAPVRVRFDEAQEVAAHFNRPNPWGCVCEHPDLALGVGYQVAGLIDTADAAAVFGEFWSVTWKAAYDAGELRGGIAGPRAPRPGPDVITLCLEAPMPFTTPTGEQSVFKSPTMQQQVGTLRPHPLGVQFARYEFALVLQLDLSAGDLYNLHLDLDRRNRAFGF